MCRLFFFLLSKIERASILHRQKVKSELHYNDCLSSYEFHTLKYEHTHMRARRSFTFVETLCVSVCACKSARLNMCSLVTYQLSALRFFCVILRAHYFVLKITKIEEIIELMVCMHFHDLTAGCSLIVVGTAIFRHPSSKPSVRIGYICLVAVKML